MSCSDIIVIALIILVTICGAGYCTMRANEKSTNIEPRYRRIGEPTYKDLRAKNQLILQQLNLDTIP